MSEINLWKKKTFNFINSTNVCTRASCVEGYLQIRKTILYFSGKITFRSKRT